MSYKERMQVGRSKAEDLIFIELQRRGLADKFYPLESVILLDSRSKFKGHIGFIIPKERLMQDMVPKEKGATPKYTIPDLIIKSKPARPIYIDGPPHLKCGVKRRDDEIDAELRELGFDPQRFPYKGDLERHPTRLTEICDEIEQVCEGVR